MGKQARGKLKARNGKERQEWNPTRSHKERLINRYDIPPEWKAEAEPERPRTDRPFYTNALPGTVDEPLPRSATGYPELDAVLDAVWRNDGTIGRQRDAQAV